MTNLKTILQTYRTILRWNGESASDLMEMLRGVAQSTPLILLQPIATMLHSFRYNRAMRFDLSRVPEPILAVDKKGNALVGTFRSMKIRQLMTI